MKYIRQTGSNPNLRVAALEKRILELAKAPISRCEIGQPVLYWAPYKKGWKNQPEKVAARSLRLFHSPSPFSIFK